MAISILKCWDKNTKSPIIAVVRTIYSWNVNGIRAVVGKGTFGEFLKTHQPDVLCLQETKAQPEQIDFDMTGYHAYWNSADKKGYSGTGILSKEKPLSVTEDLPENIAKKYQLSDQLDRDSASEGRVLTAEYANFYVVSVYTPNAKDDLSRIPLRHKHWDPAFLEYMVYLDKTKPVVSCGDLNVAHTPDDLARPKENEGKKGYTKEEREGLDKMVKAGFVDSFRLFNKGNGFYTWWTHWANARARNIGWRIDYCMVSKQLVSKITKAEIHPDVMGSDHCPVSVTIDD